MMESDWRLINVDLDNITEEWGKEIDKSKEQTKERTQERMES